jgi:environmental stress-induced protein Ves
MTGWTLIPGESLAVSPWRNGRGTSRNIVTRTDPGGALLWQVGIADLAQDGPFSHYPHADRIFTPIAGDPPPELAFHGGPFESCPLLTPKPFSGEWPTLSRIPAPGQAFNAIVDRRYHRAEVTVLRPHAGDMIAPPAADTAVLHVLTGRIGAAGPGDSLLGAAASPALQATEPGVAILVAIYAADSDGPTT